MQRQAPSIPGPSGFTFTGPKSPLKTTSRWAKSGRRRYTRFSITSNQEWTHPFHSQTLTPLRCKASGKCSPNNSPLLQRGKEALVGSHVSLLQSHWFIPALPVLPAGPDWSPGTAMPRGKNVSHLVIENPITRNSILVLSHFPFQHLAKNAVTCSDEWSSQFLEKLTGFSFPFPEISTSLAGNSASFSEGREGRQSGHVPITTHSFARSEWLGSLSPTCNYSWHHLNCLCTATLPSQGNT